MGHSLGAATSYGFGILYPDEVDYVICIEAFKPSARTNNLEQLENILKKFPKYNDNGNKRTYAMDEIRKKMSESINNQVPIDHIHHLIERNIEPSNSHPGNFC